MGTAYLNRVSTAVPQYDVHTAFVDYALGMLQDVRVRNAFQRMSTRAAIHHRYSVLSPGPVSNGDINAYDFYDSGAYPETARRMRVYEQAAPALAYRTLDRLQLTPAERARISHVIVTSCTGLYAPGLDFQIVDHLGLSPYVERTMIGFMGCYAAVNALKSARHIVRSEPDAAVLILNLELCTLHFKQTQDLNEVLSYLVFADGCAASLVTADPVGFALDSFRSMLVPETRPLITWTIGDLGFDMILSGQVPGHIRQTIQSRGSEILGGADVRSLDLWAIHPGGRTILDAVQDGFALPADALHPSREVLCRYGNMSSATVMFVLERLLSSCQSGQTGCAMAFGPGLTAETFLFHAA